jgi:hypothetical protein
MREEPSDAIKARHHSPPRPVSSLEFRGTTRRRLTAAAGVLGACLVVAAVYSAPGWRVYLAILLGVVTGAGAFWSLNR